jgi:F-type H+/Na+-transporting ATPase subunit alpha
MSEFDVNELLGRIRQEAQEHRERGEDESVVEETMDAQAPEAERPTISGGEFKIGSLLKGITFESSPYRHKISVSDVGTVLKVGDGVATISGLPNAVTDGLVEFPTGTLGLILNLEGKTVDCILLGPDEGIQGGDLVTESLGKLQVPVGRAMLGRVVDPLGRPLDGGEQPHVEERRFIERPAPTIVERQAVNEPLQTGIKAVDAMVPIGRGQRELIVGDRQTGKTTIALDTIMNQHDKDVICVYVSIGQRKAALLQAIEALRQHDALSYTTIVVAAADDPPAVLYIAPYVGCTLAEHFMDEGHDVLVVYDDLTKHANAYRELSLLLRRPPGREAYPGDIFYLHSRLLERAGRFNEKRGGGSMTALPIVETQRGNISAYIPTNLISITDGQIFLSPGLYNQGIRPAIDVGLSVSRVGGKAQKPIMRAVSSDLRLQISQYSEVVQFARFGTEVDDATRRQILRGERLQEALKQPRYTPLPLAEQLALLYAISQGHLDDLQVDRVQGFEQSLWRYLAKEHPSITRRLSHEDDLDDELEADLEEAIEAFRTTFQGGTWKISSE